MFVRKFSKSLLQCIALCFVLSFSSSTVSGEENKYGLSVDNIHIFYFAESNDIY